MNKNQISTIIVFILLALDQISKLLVVKNFETISNGISLSSFLNIVYVENRGVSFGMFAEHDKSFYFGIFSILVSFYIIFLIINSKKSLETVGLSMILGGALGNGFDRLINEYVVDFIDFHLNNFHWPAFNFADSFITIGAFIFIYDLIKNK